MTYKEFEVLLNCMHKEEQKIVSTKGVEYTVGDQLDNFKRIGKEVKCVHCGEEVGAKVVLWIYLKKHLDGLLSYINKDKELSEETVIGRLKDARVYLALLRGLIYEEKNMYFLKKELEDPEFKKAYLEEKKKLEEEMGKEACVDENSTFKEKLDALTELEI